MRSSTWSTAVFPPTWRRGSAEEIEEERRLLYVAMTRAKDELDLIVPQRFYVHGQSRLGIATFMLRAAASSPTAFWARLIAAAGMNALTRARTRQTGAPHQSIFPQTCAGCGVRLSSPEGTVVFTHLPEFLQ